MSWYPSIFFHRLLPVSQSLKAASDDDRRAQWWSMADNEWRSAAKKGAKSSAAIRRRSQTQDSAKMRTDKRTTLTKATTQRVNDLCQLTGLRSGLSGSTSTAA